VSPAAHPGRYAVKLGSGYFFIMGTQFSQAMQEQYLRSKGWIRLSNGLWQDPDRPWLHMSTRTAFYCQTKKDKSSNRTNVRIQK
jgi:hypothetical protein